MDNFYVEKRQRLKTWLGFFAALVLFFILLPLALSDGSVWAIVGSFLIGLYASYCGNRLAYSVLADLMGR